jgi:hypothetical protein
VPPLLAATTVGDAARQLAGTRMGYLDVDLWPAGLVLVLAALAIIALRVSERRADALVALRTREALRRALGEHTEE